MRKHLVLVKLPLVHRVGFEPRLADSLGPCDPVDAIPVARLDPRFGYEPLTANRDAAVLSGAPSNLIEDFVLIELHARWSLLAGRSADTVPQRADRSGNSFRLIGTAIERFCRRANSGNRLLLVERNTIRSIVRCQAVRDGLGATES